MFISRKKCLMSIVLRYISLRAIGGHETYGEVNSKWIGEKGSLEGYQFIKCKNKNRIQGFSWVRDFVVIKILSPWYSFTVLSTLVHTQNSECKERNHPAKTMHQTNSIPITFVSSWLLKAHVRHLHLYLLLAMLKRSLSPQFESGEDQISHH